MGYGGWCCEPGPLVPPPPKVGRPYRDRRKMRRRKSGR